MPLNRRCHSGENIQTGLDANAIYCMKTTFRVSVAGSKCRRPKIGHATLSKISNRNCEGKFHVRRRAGKGALRRIFHDVTKYSKSQDTIQQEAKSNNIMKRNPKSNRPTMGKRANSLLIDYSRSSAVADGAITLRSAVLVQRRKEEQARIAAGIPDCVFSLERRRQRELIQKPKRTSSSPVSPKKNQITFKLRKDLVDRGSFMCYFKQHYSESDCDLASASDQPILNPFDSTECTESVSDAHDLNESCPSDESCLSSQQPSSSSCSQVTPASRSSPPASPVPESQADAVTRTRQESRVKRGRRDALKETLRKSHSLRHFGLDASPISNDLEDSSSLLLDMPNRRRIPSRTLSSQSTDTRRRSVQEEAATQEERPAVVFTSKRALQLPRNTASSNRRRMYRASSLKHVLDCNLKDLNLDLPRENKTASRKENLKGGAYLRQGLQLSGSSNHTAGAVANNLNKPSNRRLMMSRQGSFVTASRIRTLRG